MMRKQKDRFHVLILEAAPKIHISLYNMKYFIEWLIIVCPRTDADLFEVKF